MSTAESKINVASGFNGGLSVSLRADSAVEFEQLLSEVTSNSPTLTGLLQKAGLAVTAQQGVANVQQAFPQAQVVNQSTVGQPLPQPQIVSTPQAQPAAAPSVPPGVTYPGDCSHGPRVYVDKPARGRAWRRFECAIPWSKGVEGRCAPVNVEG